VLPVNSNFAENSTFGELLSGAVSRERARRTPACAAHARWPGSPRALRSGAGCLLATRLRRVQAADPAGKAAQVTLASAWHLTRLLKIRLYFKRFSEGLLPCPTTSFIYQQGLT